MTIGCIVRVAQELVMFQVPTISPPQAATLPHDDAAPPLLLLPQPVIATPIAMHAIQAFIMEVLRGAIIAHLAPNDQIGDARSHFFGKTTFANFAAKSEGVNGFSRNPASPFDVKRRVASISL